MKQGALWIARDEKLNYYATQVESRLPRGDGRVANGRHLGSAQAALDEFQQKVSRRRMAENSGTESEHDVKLGRIGSRPHPVMNLSILIRAVHQIGAAVFLAAYLLDAVPGPPRAYVVVAMISGGLLFVCEWWRHRQIFRELAGAITMMKIGLLGAALHGFLPPAATVLAVFFFASLGSHAPKKVRHMMLF